MIATSLRTLLRAAPHRTGASLGRPLGRLPALLPPSRQEAPALARLLASAAEGRAAPAAVEEPAADALFARAIEQLEGGALAAAVQLFADGAAADHAESHFYLGLAYDGLLGEDARGGLPVEQDPEAAARCYLRASDLGHAEAMFNLSLCYRLGEGVERDAAAAFSWAERGAALGCERAQYNLGVALDPQHPPWGTPGAGGANAMIAKDPARAARLYADAAEQGHAKAKVNLGILLYEGAGGGAPDQSAAIKLWREAREEGVPQAELCLKNAGARLTPLE